MPLFLIMALGILSNPSPVQSAAGLQEANPNNTEFCLSCHQVEGVSESLPNGEQLSLTIDAGHFIDSVHAAEGLSCADCHLDYQGFPHPKRNIDSLRSFVQQENTVCQDCHEEQGEAHLAGVHQIETDRGNLAAAFCSDCHDPHRVQAGETQQNNPALICAECHAPVFELYQESVHGEALIQEGNPDVPSCIDCHGVHDIQGSSTPQFHLFSPQICAECHADEELTAKYDLNPNVFDSYVADFHGTTVTLFEEVSPDQETNKPVCIDCHGVHGIRASDDPESRVVKENLLATCQRCHPDATDDFPDSWLSHYNPSWEETPIVSTVDLFYQIVLPATVVGMLVFVVPDGVRRLGRRFSRKSDD